MKTCRSVCTQKVPYKLYNLTVGWLQCNRCTIQCKTHRHECDNLTHKIHKLSTDGEMKSRFSYIWRHTYRKQHTDTHTSVLKGSAESWVRLLLLYGNPLLPLISLLVHLWDNYPLMRQGRPVQRSRPNTLCLTLTKICTYNSTTRQQNIEKLYQF